MNLHALTYPCCTGGFWTRSNDTQASKALTHCHRPLQELLPLECFFKKKNIKEMFPVPAHRHSETLLQVPMLLPVLGFCSLKVSLQTEKQKFEHKGKILNRLSLIILRGQSWRTSGAPQLESHLSVPGKMTLKRCLACCHSILFDNCWPSVPRAPLKLLSCSWQNLWQHHQTQRTKAFPVNTAICHCSPYDQLISQNSKHFAFVLPFQREVASASKSARLNRVNQVETSRNNKDTDSWNTRLFALAKG